MRAGSVRTILELCDEFTPGENPEFFFDRNPDNFPAILNLYRTGRLHATERGCALVLQQDLQVRQGWRRRSSVLERSSNSGLLEIHT